MKRFLSRAIPRLTEDLRIELGIVYAAGILPFLGSFLRDGVILSRASLGASDLFFRFFYLSNLTGMVQAEFLWTSYNMTGRTRAFIPAGELLVLVLGTAAAGAGVFGLAGWPDPLWAAMPVLSILVAYPIGILNGWKRYFASKVVSTAPSALMAVFVLGGITRLSGAYALALVLSLAGALAILAAGHGVRVTRDKARFDVLLHSILLTSLPFALFYLGNFLLLTLSGPKSRFVLWGNRISNYIFTFLLLATPVFLNALKDRAVGIGRFSLQIRMAAASAAIVLALAAFLRPSAPDWALVLLNLDITIVAALAHYLVKVRIVRKLRSANDGARG
jgi:hypothetical protein